MKRLIQLGLTLCLAVPAAAGMARPAAAAATCSAGLTIFTTSIGTVTTTGPVQHFSNSGVGGRYTAGFLAGYTFGGTQDIMINTITNQSELRGSYTATGPDGALVVSYTGHADLTSGVATGHFETMGGTGALTSFHWSGSISAQLVSLTPPTFVTLDSGPCTSAP